MNSDFGGIHDTFPELRQLARAIDVAIEGLPEDKGIAIQGELLALTDAIKSLDAAYGRCHIKDTLTAMQDVGAGVDSIKTQAARVRDYSRGGGLKGLEVLTHADELIAAALDTTVSVLSDCQCPPAKPVENHLDRRNGKL